MATWTQDVGSDGVALLDPARAAAFRTSFLGPLAAAASALADGIADPLDVLVVLVETLDAFLRQHGSQHQVSVVLGIHRNTVRHRIRRIEEVLGRSLADPQTRSMRGSRCALPGRFCP